MHGPLGFMAATIMILGYTHPCWSVMQTDLMHANSVAQTKGSAYDGVLSACSKHTLLLFCLPGV